MPSPTVAISKSEFTKRVQSILRKRKTSPVEKQRQLFALYNTTMIGLGYGDGVQLAMASGL